MTRSPEGERYYALLLNDVNRVLKEVNANPDLEMVELPQRVLDEFLNDQNMSNVCERCGIKMVGGHRCGSCGRDV